MPPRHALAFAATVAVALPLGLGGCRVSPGHPPTARATAQPEFLPLDDGYRTDVVLDGRGSKDEIDDPAGTLPLAFRWEIDDPAPRVVTGSLDAALVTVRLEAARPTPVRLAVTDSGGERSVASLTVGITLPPDM